MNLGKKEGIVVVGEIQKREIMPLTLELIGAAGKLSKERNLSLSVILSGCGIKEEAKKLYNYGVDEILCIEDEKLIEGHMQLHHDAVIEVLKEKDPKVILIGGTASGRVLAGKTDVSGYVKNVILVSNGRTNAYQLIIPCLFGWSENSLISLVKREL